jgi:hypothetical protein
MNVVLWSFQVLLASLFLYSGLVKSTQKREKIIEIGQTGVKALSYPLIRFIGISEIAGAFGIILPWALGICKMLTPLTAVGFGMIMVLAARKHLQLKEPKTALANVIVLTVSIFVAVMRFNETL